MPEARRTARIHRLLHAWMRLVALLLPRHAREGWRDEWDGELWYGVRARAGRLRVAAAVGLAVGLLRDAFHTRRYATRHGTKSAGATAGLTLRSLIADVRYGLRTMRKTPGFTAVVVITLALGIGATVTIFSVVDALLLRPLPYPDADRLVLLWQGRRGADVDRDWFSFGQFTDIQTQTDVFEELSFVSGASSTVTGRGSAVRTRWLRARAAYLRMLGAKTVLGRVFDEQDDRGDASPVALLTHGEWQRAYGGDPGVVGRAVTLDGRDVEIVGVLSPDLLIDDEVMPVAGHDHARIDMLLSFPLTADSLEDRVVEWYNIIGRLRPGVTLAQAQSQLDLVAAGIQQSYESDPGSGFFIRAVPLIDEVVGSVRRALLVLLASVGVVLLIACVNVANLLLARGGTRLREMGIRASLGAPRRRLVRQLLAESAVLATLGGVVGVALAVTALRLLQWLGTASLPRISEIGIDGRVLLFSLAITAATCVVFGLVPALRASRVDPVRDLKASGRTTIAGGTLWSRFNLSSALVVTEIAMSLVLLVGGALLVRSFIALRHVDPGFQADNRLTFRVDLTGEAYRRRETLLDFYDRLSERLSTLPGVAAVTASSNLPFDRSVNWAPIDIADYVPPQGPAHQIISEYRVARPGYFEAMGIPLIRGRDFDARDDRSDPHVAIIDQYFADRYFPDRDPIGMRLLTWGPDTLTIVGIAGTVRNESLDRTSRVTTYQPQRQLARRGMYIVLRTANEPATLAAQATRVVADIDPGVAVVDVRNMRSRVDQSLARRRFSMTLLQLMGVVALVLAIVGIHGLVSYRVNQGTRELSLRMALGASPGGILKLVLEHGLTLASAGVAAGLVAALALTGFMRSMLFGVGALDVASYATVASILAMTALIACWIPARRATRVNPLDAIRGE